MAKTANAPGIDRTARPLTIADEQAAAFEADRKRALPRFIRASFPLPLLRN